MTRPRFLALLAVFMAIPACACFQQGSADFNAPKCVAARASVDCTKSAAAQLGPVALGVITSLIGGQNSIDWTEVGKAAGLAGVADGGCILAQVSNVFLAKKMAARKLGAAGDAQVSAIDAQHTDFESFRAKWNADHGLAGSTFTLPSGAVVK